MSRREVLTMQAVVAGSSSSAGALSVAFLAGVLLSSGCNKAEKPASKTTAVAPAEGAAAAKVVSGATNVGANITGAGKEFSVALFFDPATPKVSQLFSLRTVVTKLDGTAVKPDAVAVDATMPAHGHGMMTKPQHKPMADGAWQTEGMKLHMHGRWLFEVNVKVGAQTETLKIPFDQPPEAL